MLHFGRAALRAAAAALLLGGSTAPAAEEGVLVGGRFEVEVRPGDSLASVSARFGLEARTLAAANARSPDAWLQIGERLQVENPHLVPALRQDGILINVPQRMLFLFRDGALARAHPVGVGRPSWPTPLGEFRVGRLEIDKTWYVPPSIQEEMRLEGKEVRTRVPPGPDNPLGRHWIGLANSSYGIHATIAPASVYRARSHGCVRLHPDDAAALFAELRVGDPVELIYAPLLLAELAEGRILLEVHPDVYKRAGDPIRTLEDEAAARGLAGRIDWERARRVAAEAEGLARDVAAARGAEEAGR